MDRFDNEKKIYTLLNVQDLLYDQAVKAHICFEKLLSQKSSTDPNFTLCIFSSAEKEEKSVFATAFNRFKKIIPLEQNFDNDLNLYLNNRFTFNKTCDSPLANIDSHNVRIVTSERSSVGKSLYIQRQIETAQTTISTEILSHCISVKKQSLPFESIFKKLKEFDNLISVDYENGKQLPKIFHIDIAYEVWYDVDYFLFNLLCLGLLDF